MKFASRLFALLLACASPAAVAAQQAEPRAKASAREPSPAALELARLLEPNLYGFVVRIREPVAIAGIEARLLRVHYAPRGRPCDPDHPNCIAAAREIARKYGPLQVRYVARIIEGAHARLFDATMSPAEIAEASAFLRSSSGRKLAGALRTPFDTDGQERIERLYRESMIAAGRDPLEGMYNEYYDRTASLPRAPQPLVPPPPPAPRAPPAPIPRGR